MINWDDALNEIERHKEYVVEAQRERLASQALGSNSSFACAYQHWLARLGARMVHWGERLQARYDCAASTLPQESQIIKNHLSTL